MKLRVGILVTVLGATQLVGCSIMDPNDRQALRDKINALTFMQILELKRVIASTNASNWLNHLPKNDEMGNVQCRIYNPTGTGASGWTSTSL